MAGKVNEKPCTEQVKTGAPPRTLSSLLIWDKSLAGIPFFFLVIAETRTFVAVFYFMQRGYDS
jgi:hypothetical protein